MTKKELTIEQKRAEFDLLIIIITAFVVLGTYIFFNSFLSDYVKNTNIPVLIRTLISASLQFGIAGLGIILVFIFRKESIFQHGLRKKHLFISLLLSALMFLPDIIFTIITGDADSYMPFQKVWITKDVLSGTVPVKIIGMTLIATAWGFFEGFNYVVIMDKLNIRFPSKNKWLDTGAITGAIMCILIHGAIGITPKDFIAMITVLISIYGMLMVRKFTGNAWGCVFVFIFLWNAY